MSQKDTDQTSDKGTGETTAGFRAAFLGELDASAAAAAKVGVGGVEELPSGSALIVVKRGPNAGVRFLLDQPLTSVGRNPDSDIYLDDVTVSRRHAELRRESPEIRIVDLGSLNGTYLNRESVQSAVLASGDEIQIGKFRLVFLTRPPREGLADARAQSMAAHPRSAAHHEQTTKAHEEAITHLTGDPGEHRAKVEKHRAEAERHRAARDAALRIAEQDSPH